MPTNSTASQTDGHQYFASLLEKHSHTEIQHRTVYKWGMLNANKRNKKVKMQNLQKNVLNCSFYWIKLKSLEHKQMPAAAKQNVFTKNNTNNKIFT